MYNLRYKWPINKVKIVQDPISGTRSKLTSREKKKQNRKRYRCKQTCLAAVFCVLFTVTYRNEKDAVVTFNNDNRNI